MIKINNIHKSYGKLPVLKDLSISIASPVSLALAGPNGSGKTTLIKSILGLVFPQKGSIQILGNDILHSPAYRDHIGYMPQIGRFPEHLRIGQLMDMLLDLRKNSAYKPDQSLFEAFQMHKIIDKSMGALSGGTRQKVGACIAFLFDTPIYILDEPTAGLDPLSVEILKEKILIERSRNKMVLITSHLANDLEELCEEMIYLMDGNVKFRLGIAELKQLTGEERLGKAIVSMLMDKHEVFSERFHKK